MTNVEASIRGMYEMDFTAEQIARILQISVEQVNQEIAKI